MNARVLWQFLTAALLLGAAPAAAQLIHINPITITTNESLAFGRFAAGSGGTITVSTAGARTASGPVLISSSSGTAARFTVGGDANSTYAITLPSNNSVSLSGPSGATMTLTNFTSSPSGTGTLSGSGTQSLLVGATLNVSAVQTPGAYSGTFSVTVDYN